jgi:hypothetical protein
VIASRIGNRTYWFPLVTFMVLLFSSASGGTEALPGGIQVEMDSQRPLGLRVTLRSGAEVPVTLYKNRLPWGSRYSMILVAVTRDGQYLKKELPVDDPSPERVTIEPRGLLVGQIDLDSVFIGLNRAVQSSDVQLFWAYEAPGDLRIPRWSGGWVLLPRAN